VKLSLWRAILSIWLAYAITIAVTIFDILIVEGYFSSVSYHGIEKYHYSMFNIFVPYLLIIIAVYIYLSRFRGGKIRFYKKAVLDVIIFLIPSLMLIMFGTLDVLYFVLQGKEIPEVLPWLNYSYLGLILQIIRGVGDVTKSELIASTILSNLVSCLIVCAVSWRDIMVHSSRVNKIEGR